MKTTTMMRLMVLSLTVVLAAACGKSGGSGGSSKKSSSSSSVVLSGNAVGEAAYTQLKAWYAAADSTPANQHIYSYKSTKSSSSGFSLNINITAYCVKDNATPPIFNPCIKPNGCFVSDSSGAVRKGSPLFGTANVANFMTTSKYIGCDTNGSSVYSKSLDSTLKNAVLGTSSSVVITSLTKQSGLVFTVFFGPTSTSSPTSYAVIDANYPAVLNPMQASSGSSVTGYDLIKTF